MKHLKWLAAAAALLFTAGCVVPVAPPAPVAADPAVVYVWVPGFWGWYGGVWGYHPGHYGFHHR